MIRVKIAGRGTAAAWINPRNIIWIRAATEETTEVQCLGGISLTVEARADSLAEAIEARNKMLGER